MNFSGTKCDECGRIKGESNHWHQMGVLYSGGGNWVELGALMGPTDMVTIPKEYEVHDLCGEACFYKHIGKLLKINPTHPMESADDA